MRLRTLTIKGFKSFAVETTLNFNEDVIGVVGPNGSGKSNVVDAIRWVLGEQKSKDLRLERMTDVIFNGTKKRKQSASAQVTLTFDNDKGVLPSQYSEVAVSRVLYRSGESEYLLNGVKCRLKDINTLLMDTGMGSNSYAIIALGMVDDILSDKDHARRHMFEQAAGISKYKIRKREAKQKLKAAQADLDRVEDLIYEIEGNLKSLEKQAKRAKKYLDIKEQYKETSIQSATLSIQELKETYKDIEKAVQVEVASYNALDVQLRGDEANLEELKRQNLSTEDSLTTTQKALNELISRLRKIETDRELLEQKISFHKQSMKQMSDELVKGESDYDRMLHRLEGDEQRAEKEANDLDLKKKALDDIQHELAEIKSQYEKTKSESDERAKALAQKKESLFDVEKSIALLENSIKISKDEEERQSKAYLLKKQEYTSIEKDILRAENEKDLCVKEYEYLLKSEENRQQHLKKLENDRDQLHNEMRQQSRILDSKKNEYSLLKSMIDNMEGFPESIKYLNDNWQLKPPVLSDLLDVDDEYKAVIELFLEPYLNYYVVDKLEAAKQAISLLHNAQKGKANFFLLDRIEPLSAPVPPYMNMTPANQVVNIDAGYQHLLDMLLHNVYIVDGKIDQYEDDDTITLLSLSGSFIRRSHSVQGGSVGLFEGKRIGRKKNLEKLNTFINKIEKEYVKTEVALSTTKNEIKKLQSQDHKKDITKYEKELRLIDKQLLELRLKEKAFDELKKQREVRSEEAETKILQYTQEKKKHTDERSKLSGEITLMENATIGTQGDLQAQTERLNTVSTEYNTKNIEYIRQQNLVETIQRDINYNRKGAENLKRKLKQNRIKLSDASTQITHLEEKVVEIRTTLAQMYEDKKEQEHTLTTVEQSYYQNRKTITDAEDKVKKSTRQQNQIQLKVQQLKENLTDVKFKITSVGERIRVEFGISINDLINLEHDIDEDKETLDKKVESLRGKLQRFGEINPMAVETYNEMQARYESITSQRDDILDARDSLEQTIAEIETTATQKYIESFEKVRVNFIEVFRSLFSEEDDCDLVLLDPNSPIESDIDIIAKPKGKKPKSLSQLSGGEKTLTATALLFSLYLLKPAPFCIFDEVDAPLDDANIQKFNKIIKKFSSQSQFIIVTHNKSTMAAVDVLYGVHMQEQGVSSVTPVDFRAFDNQFIAKS